MIDLALIRIDGGTQSRAELNQETVSEYADAYKAGAKFPPVKIFFDGKNRWLADGFHRFFAAKAAGEKEILESIEPGTLRDAILYSVKANATHGLKRTNADKRQAVETLLKDTEWASWSDRKIAELCGVGAPLVGDVRRSICNPITDAPATRTVERNGKTYEQNTANICKTAPAVPAKGPEAMRAAAKPAVVEPEVEAPPEYSELDATKDALSVISEENDRLNDRLAIAAFEATDEERSAAHETLTALRAENKTLTATLRAVTLSRDSLMEENAQMKRQMAMQRKEIDKLKNNK